MNPQEINALSDILSASSSAAQPSLTSSASLSGGSTSEAGSTARPLFRTVVHSQRQVDVPAESPPPSPNAIWSKRELDVVERLLEASDSEGDVPDDVSQRVRKKRREPVYDVLFSSHLSANDVYLSAADVDLSAEQCDRLVVLVELGEVPQFPGRVARRDVHIDVTDSRLVVATWRHKLVLHLPKPVDSAAGRATFDADKQELRVELPVRR